MPQGKFAQFVEGNDPAPAKGRFASFVESSDSGAQSSTPSTRQVAKPRTTSRTAPPPQPVSPSRFEQPPIGQALLEESKSFERSPRVAETERARREFESLPVTERMGRRVKTGYNQGAQFAADTVSRIGDIAGGAIEGNFEPLREQIEGAKQGLRVGAARLMPAIVSPKVAPEAQAALARNEQSRDSRRRAEGDLTYIGGQEESRRLQAEAEADPSLAGGVTRGAVSGAISSLPYLAASVAGGGVPALAGVAAATSDYTRPGEAAANIAGSVLPVKAARAAGPLINRAATALPRVAPAIRGAAPVAIGAGTNVAQSVAMGKTDPGELAEQATIGALMSGTDAYQAARRGPVGFERGTRTAQAEPPVSNVGQINTPGPVSDTPPTFPRMMGPPARRVATPKETRITPKLNTEQARADLAEVTKQARTDPQAAAEVPEYRALAQAMGPGQLPDKAIAESAARAEARQAERRARVGTQNRGVGVPDIPAQMEMLEPPLPPRRRGLSGVGAPNIPEQMDVTPPLANQPGTRPPVRGTGLGSPNIPESMISTPQIEGNPPRRGTPSIEPPATSTTAPRSQPEVPPTPDVLAEQAPRRRPAVEQSVIQSGRPTPRTLPAPPPRRMNIPVNKPTPESAKLPQKAEAAQVKNVIPEAKRTPDLQKQLDFIARAEPAQLDRAIVNLEGALPGMAPDVLARRQEILKAANARRSELVAEGKLPPKFKAGAPEVLPLTKKEGAEMFEQPTDIRDADREQRRAMAQAQKKGEPYAIHQDFGPITKAENQKGVPRLKVRVVDEQGETHIVNKRDQNQRAIIQKERGAETGTATPKPVEPSISETPTPAPASKQNMPERDTGPLDYRDIDAKAQAMKGEKRKDTIEQLQKRITERPAVEPEAAPAAPEQATPSTTKAAPRRVARASTKANTDADVIRAMAEVKPSVKTGGLVPVSEMRAKSKLKGDAFDSAVLDLARKGVIALHRHDFPTSLKPEELAGMIREKAPDAGTQGTGYDYYVGAAFRDTNNPTIAEALKAKPKRGRVTVGPIEESKGGTVLGAGLGSLQPLAERGAKAARRVAREIGERVSVGELPRTRADVENSPRFKQWFEGSKVADKSGKPLVVYHGTAGDFSTFDPAKANAKSQTGVPPGTFFFTDKPDVASSYTVAQESDFAALRKLHDKANVMPVYLKMERPLKLNAKSDDWQNVLYKGEYRNTNEIAEMARKSGRYDGVIIARVADKGVGAVQNKVATTYIAFSPTQIKSATGNSGQFSSSTGNIMGAGLGGLQGGFRRQQKPQVQPSARLQQRAQQQGGATGKRIPAPVEPKTFGQRFKEEAISVVNAPRSIQSSVDISAPLRQGAVLTLPPTQWGRAARAGVQMFKSFSTKQHEQFTDDLNNRPDAQDARDAGLYLASDSKKTGLAQREEAFMSRLTENLPIIKHSGQAYAGYLDALRSSTFTKYKNVIDRANLSPEETAKGYKAAADWINTATGRGSLGSTIDSAMPALSTVLFSPRFVASRLQLLNPVTYAKNATSPGKRAVLKQQLGDAVQFAAVVSATLGLAKAAGAEVGTDPESPDFLKIKAGKTTYDFLAGIQQPMRLFYRIAEDVRRAAKGEPAKRGADTLSLLGRFGRSKLAPTPSFGVDMVARKDFIGRPFEVKRAIVDRVAPMFLKDAIEAYQQEGLAGTAKVLPGALGVGVQSKRESAAPRTRSDRNRRRRRGRDRRER